jgi:hypothetical protein
MNPAATRILVRVLLNDRRRVGIRPVSIGVCGPRLRRSIALLVERPGGIRREHADHIRILHEESGEPNVAGDASAR